MIDVILILPPLSILGIFQKKSALQQATPIFFEKLRL